MAKGVFRTAVDSWLKDNPFVDWVKKFFTDRIERYNYMGAKINQGWAMYKLQMAFNLNMEP